MGKTEWYLRSRIKLHSVAIIIAVWTIPLSLLQDTPLGRKLRFDSELAAYYNFRDFLEKSPQLDPRIKVIALDDETVSWFGSDSLDWNQWLALLKSLSDTKPEYIIIDNSFDVANIRRSNHRKTTEVIRTIGKLNTKIIIGSLVSDQKISFRQPLSVEGKNFSLRALVSDQMSSNQVGFETRRLPISEVGDRQIYGPPSVLHKTFRRIGHIDYRGDGYIAPFLRVDAHTAIPHIMLLTEKSRRYFRRNLFLNQQKVFVNREGRIPVNFSALPHFKERTLSLRRVLARAEKGMSLKGFAPGDYVYIMPFMHGYTNQAHATPLGSMPRGYAHLAILNSILTKKWLKPIHVEQSFVVGAAAAGALFAFFLNPIGLMVTIGFVVGFWVMFSLLGFAFWGLLIPFLFPLFAMICVALSIAFGKMRDNEMKAQFIHSVLEGAVSPDQLDAVVKRPEKLDIEARERVVTVMFIDVVGFSLVAENQVPRIAFDHLKAVLTEISQHVYRYGGIVNKNLGDGLLCFFGYSFDSDVSTFNHAEKAIRCGIEIQKSNLLRLLESHRRGDPVYPLRIGVNTSSVFMGNLGTGVNIDLTVVGHGVNFAKRLESGCENHGIMMSRSTKELVEGLGLPDDYLTRRFIEIKHHPEPIEAWDYDPFGGNSELKIKADDAYRSCTQNSRQETRWTIHNSGNFLVATNCGNGTLVNISLTGTGLILQELMVKGSLISIHFDSLRGDLKLKLSDCGIETINAEVRWGYLQQGKAMHGVKYRNLSADQQQQLRSILMECDKEMGSHVSVA